jgi:hypothetical protein
VADTIDDFTRLALFEAWGERCVWCNRPLFFDEMEVEHLLPKSLEGDERSAVIAGHGRPADFDLESLDNLAPSCRPCNGRKGKRPPPNAPVVASVLDRAHESAPGIRTTVEKFRGRRSLARALTIVRGQVQSGDEEALRRLREAAEEISTALEATVGAGPTLLSSALPALTRVGDALRGDPYFTYPAVVHKTGQPAPGLTPGTVMSISEISDELTKRFDAVPRDLEGIERFIPRFTLIPGDDEAGTRAGGQLADALREGRSIVIEEGIDVSFEQLPPKFAQLEGRPMTGRVELTAQPAQRLPREPVPDWDAELTAVTPEQRRSIRMLLQETAVPSEGWDASLVGRLGGLTATVSFREREGRGQLNWNFKHRRDASSVREQLATLRFVEALSSGARLEVVDRGPAKRRRPRLGIDGPLLSHDDVRPLMLLMEDLRMIELWAKVEFELPDELTAGEASDIAQVADLVRGRGRSITWADAILRTSETGLEQLRGGASMRIRQNADATVLGKLIELGIVQTDIAAYEVASATPAPDCAGMLDVRIVPTDGQSAEIFERLLPAERTKPRRPDRTAGPKKNKHGRPRR